MARVSSSPSTCACVAACGGGLSGRDSAAVSRPDKPARGLGAALNSRGVCVRRGDSLLRDDPVPCRPPCHVRKEGHLLAWPANAREAASAFVRRVHITNYRIRSAVEPSQRTVRHIIQDTTKQSSTSLVALSGRKSCSGARTKPIHSPFAEFSYLCGCTPPPLVLRLSNDENAYDREITRDTRWRCREMKTR